jgi:hypothetical protein
VKLEQSFTVEAPLERVWEALIDVQRVAPCLPGAEITEAGDDGTYRGTFTVKLGPTTAAYRGELSMESVDEAARRVTMDAKGQDKLGQGHDRERDARAGRRHQGRRGDRLHDHRPPGALWAGRDDQGRFESAAARLLGLLDEDDRG